MGEFALAQFQYLLAGFVASWVFYGLTPYKRPTPFERVVQALIYTAVVQLTAEGLAWALGKPDVASHPPAVFGLALAAGLAAAWMANYDLPHKWLARWKITSQSAYVNNFSRAFETRKGEYVVLTLKNGRRIYGWPLSWPDHPDEDFFLLGVYEWLPGPNDDATAAAAIVAANQKISPEGAILIAAKDVDVVEFASNRIQSGETP